MTTHTIAPTRATRPVQELASAVALVGSPLLLLAYFAAYPAYGETHSADIARSIAENPDATRVADVFAFASVFLAVPATLALLRVLRPGSPRLAAVGATLAITGWMALVGALMTDVVAIEIGGDAALFHELYTSPFVIGLNALAGLHIVGGVLLGICLIRTRVIPRAFAVAATLAPVVHLGSNLAGQFWLDALTWLVMATVGALVAARLLSPWSAAGG